MKETYNPNDYLVILQLSASDIYYSKVSKKPLYIDNEKDKLDYRFRQLLSQNLDLLKLSEIKAFVVKKLGDEQYSYDLINVSFDYDCLVNKKGNQIKEQGIKLTDKRLDHDKSANKAKIRDDLYLNGFELNDCKYVKYKRSSSSARTGECLFIKESLFKKMDKWSNTGLDPKKYTNDIVSFEAYKSLSLSGLIDTIELNPYNILFVDDVEPSFKEKVARVFYDKTNKRLDVKEEEFEVKNKIWDGEGLLDTSIFQRIRAHSRSEDIVLKTKSMLLLRNRFFKSCVLNTKLQIWFKKNGITSVEQLKKNGFTLAKDIKDIVLVVTKSSLKYVRFFENVLNEKSIKAWCRAVSNDKNMSLFGIVKTDKHSRFFNGDMVELSNSFLNTINIKKIECKTLLALQISDYINKIRNIKDTPEYLNLFLNGEATSFAESDDYCDDSEYDEDELANSVFCDTTYTFKKTIASVILDCNKDALKTPFFRHFAYEDVISSLALKLYNGKILVHGVNATIFGNPYELLLKTIGKFDNVKSCFLHKGEVCCPFFNKTNLVGNRNPHITMGNILCAKNVRNPEIEKWFVLNDEIVVVDAIENNIQQRLNGMDYDSDSVLLTDNELLYKCAKENYEKFSVPVADLKHVENEIKHLDKDSEKNIILNVSKIDNKIANNLIGSISNTAQLLNSIYWDRVNRGVDTNDIYLNICKAAILCGAEIDSAKRSFEFETNDELNKLKNYYNSLFSSGQSKRPLFALMHNKEARNKISMIEDHINKNKDRSFECTIDYIWVIVKTHRLDEPKITDTKNFSDLTVKGKSLGGSAYDKVNRIIEALESIYNWRALKSKGIDKDNFESDKRELKNQINFYLKKIRKYFDDTNVVRLAVIKIEKDHTEAKKIKRKAHGTFMLFLLLYIFYIVKGKNGLRALFSTEKPIDKLIRNDKLIHTKFSLFGKYKYEIKNN